MGQLLALALLATPSASAAPASPASPTVQELVHKSVTDYNLGYFDAALREIEEAYRLEQLPALLFNLGQCHRALEHWDRAAFFYRSYLRNLPNAKNRELVRDLIDKMAGRGLIDRMVAKDKEDAAAKSAPPPHAAPSIVLVEAPPAAAPAAATSAPPAVEATTTSERSGAWPWVMGAGAVAFAGAAVWGWVQVGSFQSAKASSVTTPVSLQSAQTQLNLATAGEVTGIAGAVIAALLVTGTVLTW